MKERVTYKQAGSNNLKIYKSGGKVFISQDLYDKLRRTLANKTETPCYFVTAYKEISEDLFLIVKRIDNKILVSCGDKHYIETIV